MTADNTGHIFIKGKGADEKEYIYPFHFDGKVILFKELKSMNEIILLIYHPELSKKCSIKTFDELIEILTRLHIPFMVEQEKAIIDFAYEYIEQIKPDYAYLSSNDHDLIVWGFDAGFRKCLGLVHGKGEY